LYSLPELISCPAKGNNYDWISESRQYGQHGDYEFLMPILAFDFGDREYSRQSATDGRGCLISGHRMTMINILVATCQIAAGFDDVVTE
jgi:hypothetical protein